MHDWFVQKRAQCSLESVGLVIALSVNCNYKQSFVNASESLHESRNLS